MRVPAHRGAVLGGRAYVSARARTRARARARTHTSTLYYQDDTATHVENLARLSLPKMSRCRGASRPFRCLPLRLSAIFFPVYVY